MPSTGLYNEVIDRADLETAGHPFHISFMAALIRELANIVERSPESPLATRISHGTLPHRESPPGKRLARSRRKLYRVESKSRPVNRTGRRQVGRRRFGGRSARRRIEVESMIVGALRGRIALIG